MQQNKAKVLQSETVALKAALGNQATVLKDLVDKVNKQHRLLTSTITLCKEFDRRFEVIKKVLVESGTLTDEKFESMMDDEAGQRRLAVGEEIKRGDVVWINYSAAQTIAGNKKTVTEENFPCRAGANALLFDVFLVGKKAGDVGLIFDGEHEGSQVHFVIDIVKAKTSIKPLVIEDEAPALEASPEETEDGTTADAEPKGDDQPPIESRGPRYEEPGTGDTQPVQ